MEKLLDLFAPNPNRKKRILPCPCPELPDLDGRVFARGIPTHLYTSFVADIPTGRDPYVVVRPLLYSLCDKDGNRIFDNNATHLAWLNDLDCSITLRWRKVADSLNHDGAATEDLEKKSDPAEDSIAS